MKGFRVAAGGEGWAVGERVSIVVVVLVVFGVAVVSGGHVSVAREGILIGAVVLVVAAVGVRAVVRGRARKEPGRRP